MRDVPHPKPRRSPCPVACSLDILGDRWSLLVVRDLLLGATRFKQFSRSPEGIPTNVLSDRLERLVAHRLVKRVPAADGTKHPAYSLTSKGAALGPLLHTLRDWGLAWVKGTRMLVPAFGASSPSRSASPVSKRRLRRTVLNQ